MRAARLRLWLGVVACGVLIAGCDALDKSATRDYEKAMQAWNAGDYRASVDAFTLMAKDHPWSPRADDALYWVGMTQFLYLGETDKALHTLNFVLKKYPRRDSAPSAQFMRAQIYELGYNEFERAIAEYRKAASYTDREVREKSLYSLGDNLFRTGKVDEARDTWLLQTREFPRGPQAKLAFYRLGTLAFSRGDLNAARLFYEQTLDVDPEKEMTAKVLYAIANCLEAEGSLKEALALYKELLPEYENRGALEIKIKALETRILKKSY